MDTRVEPFRLTVENRIICGLLHLPARTALSCVITCHGLFSSKDSDKFISIADYFVQEGIAVLRFDFGGCGESTGSVADTTITGRCAELAAIIQFATQRLLPKSIGLLGSSLGGFVSLLHAAQDPSITALSVWATPFCFEDLRDTIPPEQKAVLKESFFADAKAYDLSIVVPKIKNLLIVHGTEDAVVPYSHAVKIFRHACQPKTLEIIAGGDHSLTKEEDRSRAIELSLRWFQERL